METSCLLVRICWTVTWRLAALEFYPSLAGVWSHRRSVWWSLMYFTYTLFLQLLGKQMLINTRYEHYFHHWYLTYFTSSSLVLSLISLLLSPPASTARCRRYVHTRSFFSFLFFSRSLLSEILIKNLHVNVHKSAKASATTTTNELSLYLWSIYHTMHSLIVIYHTFLLF